MNPKKCSCDSTQVLSLAHQKHLWPSLFEWKLSIKSPEVLNFSKKTFPIWTLCGLENFKKKYLGSFPFSKEVS